MTVVCDGCKTGNRDTAMFCRGCAGKLPGFAATGPSALAGLQPSPAVAPALARARGGAAATASVPAGFPRVWIGLGLLLVAMAVTFTGWYVHVTRKVVPIRTQQSAAAPAPVAVTGLPLTLLTPVEPAPTFPMPAVPPVQAVVPPTAEPAPEPPARTQRRPVQTAAVARTAASDPRSSCRHLNFIAAARCEAAQCDRTEYSRHPRCATVREDRRRDEARRNPLMAN